MTIRITDDQWVNLVDVMVDYVLVTTGRDLNVSSERRGNSLVLTVTLEPSEDDILASAPEYVANMAEAEAEIAAGEKGTPYDQAFDDLEGQS